MWTVPENIDDIELTDEQRELIETMSTLQARFAICLATGAKTYAEAYRLADGPGKRLYDTKNGSYLWRHTNVQKLYYSLIKTPIAAAALQRKEAVEMLTKMANVRISDVCVSEEVVIGEDELGLPVTQTYTKLKDLETLPDHVQKAVKSVTYTKFGPKVELYGREDAIKQLRAMQGWDAPTKKDLTSSDGSMTPTIIERRIVDPKEATE